jgi:hypothetical protein
LVEDHIALLAADAVRALESARRMLALEPESTRRNMETISLHSLARMYLE